MVCPDGAVETKKMGSYGVSLPFIVGALAQKESKLPPGNAEIQAILQALVHNPVEGFVVQVRWCGDIKAPVFSVAKLNSPEQMHFASAFFGDSGNPVSGFSADLQSMFGLNCKGSLNCLEMWIKHATPFVEKGNFSRLRNLATKTHEYGLFSKKEIEFISTVINE